MITESAPFSSQWKIWDNDRLSHPFFHIAAFTMHCWLQKVVWEKKEKEICINYCFCDLSPQQKKAMDAGVVVMAKSTKIVLYTLRCLQLWGAPAHLPATGWRKGVGWFLICWERNDCWGLQKSTQTLAVTLERPALNTDKIVFKSWWSWGSSLWQKP